MKSIVIDIDGVACAHAEAICKKINTDFDLNSCVDDVKTWDYDFGPIKFTEAVEKYYPDTSFVMAMRPTDGFCAFLHIIESLFVVVFASARTHSMLATRKWVESHFGGTFDVEFVRKKVSLNPDFLIDDNPAEVESVAKTGGVAFLYKRPWNDNNGVVEQLEQYENAIIVNSFQDILLNL